MCITTFQILCKYFKRTNPWLQIYCISNGKLKSMVKPLQHFVAFCYAPLAINAFMECIMKHGRGYTYFKISQNTIIRTTTEVVLLKDFL